MDNDSQRVEGIIRECMDKRQLLRFNSTATQDGNIITNLNFGTMRGEVRRRLAIEERHLCGTVIVTLYHDGITYSAGQVETHTVTPQTARRILDYIHGLYDGLNRRPL